ncbi:beta-ketoacyl synthase N-terminal-like domain-containing protein [Flavobacterium rhizosphaerae]|uniref:Beta-ketoacyl synthase N-terminal-like domain-containing protein n=1 Tax=Flavobacterium rhizosphaerae TaxID=3163298 RepID=A0ABW8YZ55_9FLAO
MKKCYINGASCISAQKTFDADFLEHAVVNDNENVLTVQEPDYKEFISPSAGRRMAKGVKNGIAASSRALAEAGIETPEGIITGTGMGCSIDSEKFLTAVLDNKEQFLTPTSFIQSTHNTVAAQIALGLQCRSYNFTYVNGAVSFESSLIDGLLQIQEGEAANILTGCVEETAQSTVNFLKLNGVIKPDGEAPYTVLNSESKGIVMSEGAAFFVLSDTQSQSTYAELKDVSIYNVLTKNEVAEKLLFFLQQNNLTITDVDAVVLGYNGDAAYDGYYAPIAELLPDAAQLYYKHLSGEFNTASSFGLWAAAKILKTQQVPQVVKANTVSKNSYSHILLYNQYEGRDHSFILLSKC